MNNITLIIIPGSGARQLSVQPNMTIADLVTNENLHGRDIIINGTGIAPANFSTTTIPVNAEVFATGSVKGNAKGGNKGGSKGGGRPANAPSTTGRPSGGGRGNNAPNTSSNK